MSTTTDTMPTEKRLAIVKHLAGGKDIDTTAAIVHLDRRVVLDVASHHGYPSTELLDRAVGLLEKKIDRDAAPVEHPQAAEIARQPAIRPAAGASTPPAAGAHSDEITSLLHAAKSHPSKRIQTAGNRAIDAIDRVKTLLREDREKNSARRKAVEQREAARAEVERLEQQLRDARARLKKKAPTKASKAPSAPGGHPCRHDGCDRTFDSSQARAMHQRRAHEGFDPKAAS